MKAGSASFLDLWICRHGTVLLAILPNFSELSSVDDASVFLRLTIIPYASGETQDNQTKTIAGHNAGGLRCPTKPYSYVLWPGQLKASSIQPTSASFDDL